MNTLEILAPAGNLKCIKSAICGGANAVYIGLPRFSARAKAENFTYENFDEVVRYCHLRGVKVYVAINTMIKDREIGDFLEDVNFVISRNADAIIIQDINIAKLIRKANSTFPIHLSTQSGICSVEGAKLAKDAGIDRVVLARETTLKEIKNIHDKVDIEIEYFIQGALCVSYSGNCYFSSIVDGNSGNRGRCAQPCRKKMKLVGEDFEIQGYNLSPKDLCFYDRMQDLIDAGVCSFKIEGRLRSAEYVYSASKLYSDYLKGKKKSSADYDNLKTSFNRGNYSYGYLHGRKSRIIDNKVQGNIGLKLGEITKAGVEKVTVESSFVPGYGDGFKVLRREKEIGGGTFQKGCQTTDRSFEIYAKNCKVGDSVHITYSTKLEQYVDNIESKVPVDMFYRIELGKPIEISINYGEMEVNYVSEIQPQQAKTNSLTSEEVEKQLTRLNDTDFQCDDIDGYLDSGLFMAKSQLNAVRRGAIEMLYTQFAETDNKNHVGEVTEPNKNIKENTATKIAVIVNENNMNLLLNVKANKVILRPYDYKKVDCSKFLSLENSEKYLYIPNYLTVEDIAIIDEILDKNKFDGLYTDGYNGVEIAKRHKLKVFLGSNCNVSNHLINSDTSVYHDDYCHSKELNIDELKYADKNGYVLSLGTFTSMTFVHCPLINGGICNCTNCKFNENIGYIDDKNRRFELHKNKLDGCIFTLLNNTYIDSRKELSGFNTLYDFSFITSEKANSLLQGQEETTKGHIKRGVN